MLVRLGPNPSSGPIGSSGVISGTTPNLTSSVPPPSSTKEVDVRPISELNLRQTQPVQQYDAGKEKENNPERGRDKLTERLAKLAKGKDSIDTSTSSGRTMSSTSSPFQQHHAGPGSLSKHSAPKLSVSPPEKPSPPDNHLICGVDDSILHLILNMGDSDVSVAPALKVTSAQVHKEADITSESESDEYGEPERKKSIKEKQTDRIAPIPIKQREPPSSFSVMSRPPMNRYSKDERRPTLIAPSSNTNAITKVKPILNTSGGKSLMNLDNPSTASNLKSNPNLASFSSSTTSSFDTTRKRSSTLIPSSSASVPATSSLSSSTFGASTSSLTKPDAGRGQNVASSANTSNTGASGPKPNSVHIDGTSKTVASGGDSVNVKAVDSAHTPRQRSSTMVPMVPSSVSSQNKNSSRVPVASTVPVKPFAMRRDSPASSTGDSSSGRAPLTPRDGSDLGSKTVSSDRKERKDEWSSGVSGLSVASTKGGMRPRGANGPNKHMQRRSVSFNDDVENEESRKNDVEGKNDAETRRKERRRGEAKAAIEVRTQSHSARSRLIDVFLQLGNVINGPGPVVSDDEDDMPINQAMNARVPSLHPMMAMGNQMSMQMPFGGVPGSSWGGNFQSQVGSPQMLVPPQFVVPTVGPNYMAAHQQAMMFAKQAYQIAVAQQAMAAAADEWDRNSVMGGSVYGDPSSSASVMMGPYMGNGWSTGSMIFPNAARSVYGGMGGLASSRSDYGGGGPVSNMAGGKWNSARSMYGDSFGQSNRSRPSGGEGDRSLAAMRNHPPMPPIPHSGSGGSSSLGNRGRGRASSGPAVPIRGGMRKASGV